MPYFAYLVGWWVQKRENFAYVIKVWPLKERRIKVRFQYVESWHIFIKQSTKSFSQGVFVDFWGERQGITEYAQNINDENELVFEDNFFSFWFF